MEHPSQKFLKYLPGFITSFAMITNSTQITVSFLKPHVISMIFSIKDYSLKADKFFRLNKVTISRLLRITQCCQLFSCLIYCLTGTDIVLKMLILSGNVLENPDPNDCNLKFFHWNLDSITARDNTKISLIEVYNSVFNYDLIAISNARLDQSISNEDIQIEWFSCDIF